MSSDPKIEVVDAQVRALPVTLASPRRRKAWLQVVGEGVVERIKRRSETSTEPDDQQCKSNAASTIAMRPTSDPRRLSRLESYFWTVSNHPRPSHKVPPLSRFAHVE